MNNLVVNNNEILLMRYTELIRITPCGKNAIRFQSFPDCRVIDENYTLMPQNAEAEIEESDNYATLTCGTLKVKVEPTPGLIEPSGDPNEIWSFGDENFEILKNLIFIREKLRPYIQKQMDIASEKGYPVMRPMFFEYSDDEICYTLDSQYMFGDDIIFAPIVEQGQTLKKVYIPDGEWILTKDKKIYTKGTYEINAEFNEFIAFVRNGSDVIECFD